MEICLGEQSRQRVTILLGCLLVATFGSPVCAVEPVDYTLSFLRDGGTRSVRLRAWIPEEVSRLRGMVLNLPGSGGDTRNITTNSSWRNRLEAMGFGIIGVRDDPDSYAYWGDTAAQGQVNLQSVLDAVAGSFDHPEISNAPIIVEGFSKGGFAATHLAYLVPERTICYIADKGVTIPFGTTSELPVPGLVIGGLRDSAVPPDWVNYCFESLRQFDATVAQVVDWNRGHTTTDTDLRLAYMAQALRVRYPQGQLPSLMPENPLGLIPPGSFTDVWLGEANPLGDDLRFVPIDDPEIAPQESFLEDPSLASWLPTETMARIYHCHNDTNTTSSALNLQASLSFSQITRVQLDISLFGIDSTRVELFHDEDLIAVLDPSVGETHFSYRPEVRGLHTFLAVAEYNSGGQVAYASDYATFAARYIPEPTTLLLLLAGLLSAGKRKR